MKRVRHYFILLCAIMLFSQTIYIGAETTTQDSDSTQTTDTGEEDTISTDILKTDSGLLYVIGEDQKIQITGYEGTKTTITIPSVIGTIAVTSIAANAFSNAAFTVVTVPESITTIGDDAFNTAVTTIKCYQSSAAYTYAKKNQISITLLDPVLNVSSKVLNVGKTVTLKVTNGTGTTTWKTSNSKIASVTSKGVVKGVKAGTAKITATNNGHKVVCTVTVTNMKLSKTTAYVTVGKTITLTLKNTGSNKVTWKSSNKSIAYVTKTGIVKGRKTGTATVTATCRNMSFTCKVSVKANEKVLYTYDLDVSDLSENTGYIGVKKVAYSGSNLKLTAYAFNNYSKKLANASTITITIYQNGRQVGQQVYTNRTLNVAAHSQKQMTFIMSSKNLTKKNMDLRTSKITAKVSVGLCTFA